MPRGTRKKQPHPTVMELEAIQRADPRTHQELYAEDGISRETWGSWVKGRRCPGIDNLARRAATLGRKIVLAVADEPPDTKS